MSLFAECFSDVCTSIPGGSQEDSQQFVTSKYPGAQTWYQAMAAKYPQAHLEKIQFGISDSYESGVGIIYFPESRLKQMHAIFQGANLRNLAAEKLALFAEDEYLLLHEAQHVLKSDVYRGHLATTVTMCSVLGVALASMYRCKYKDADLVTGFATTACAAAVAYAGLIMYGRYQESRADDFANQHADAQALRAGKNWFARLNTLLSFENIMIPDCLNSFSQFLQDPVHPTPKSRANKALQSLMIRFGQIA